MTQIHSRISKTGKIPQNCRKSWTSFKIAGF